MKTLFLGCCLILLGLAPPCFGQVVRYRSADKHIWTPLQVDSMVQAMNNNERMQKAGIVFNKQITNTITKPDTVIHEFVLNGANAGVRKNRDRYAAFVGRPLPPFILPDLKGKLLQSEELRGKPLVINLWFTTCAPCITEMPALNRIQREKAGITFLAMTYESPEKVKAFLQKHAFTFRHAVGAQAYCDQFTQNYPLSIFVNRQGLITAVLEGMPQVYDAAKKAPSDAVDDKAFYAALKQIE